MEQTYERFYEDTLTDSNVITVEQLKETLTNLGVDLSEMSKNFLEINFDSIVQ